MGFLTMGYALSGYRAELGETAVTIPDGIRKIDNRAFINQKQLTKVVMPESVEYIGSYAFAGCTNLREIIFSISPKRIGNHAFDDTPWLAAQGDFIIIGDTLHGYAGAGGNVRIPDGVKRIVKFLFYHNETITDLYLPDGLRIIERNAFNGCEHLCSVNLPDSVQYIGDCAFSGCKGIRTLSVPSGVKEIGIFAFSDTAWIEAKNEELTILGDGILYRCKTRRNKVILPQEIKRITKTAFLECSTMPVLVMQTAQGKLTVYGEDREFPVKEWEIMMQIVHESDPQKQETMFSKLNKNICKIPLALHMASVHGSAFFKEYLRHIVKKAMRMYITHDDTEAVSQMMQLGLVTSKNVDGFITYANTAGALESQMLLMHYKHEELGYKKPENAFRL